MSGRRRDVVSGSFWPPIPGGALDIARKKTFFYFMQENDDSRNSNQTLKHLDCACLYGRGGTGKKDVGGLFFSLLQILANRSPCHSFS